MDRVTGERFATMADRFAAGIAIAALVLGLLAVLNWRVDFGAELVRDGDYVRIASVGTNSPARREGFEPGMIVVGLNGVDLGLLPGNGY